MYLIFDINFNSLQLFVKEYLLFQSTTFIFKPAHWPSGESVRQWSGPGDLGSIPGRVLPKTLKMVLDISLHKTQQYKVRIKGNVEQYRE